MNIVGTTAVFGVIGDPIEHTMSPIMHNTAIAHMGIDAVYVPFHVLPEELERAIRGMTALGIRGMNVTVPHKTRVIQFLDRLTGEAEAVGAVNTIINRDGLLMGDNTDVYGFITCITLDGGLERFPERVCVLGAGGAARAVVYACAMREEVSKITIINRTISKAEKIADDLTPITGKVISPMPAEKEAFHKVLPSTDLIINTTSVGMYPDVENTPVPDVSLFHEGQLVCDIIANPAETHLLRDAVSQGAHTVGGLAMLANQGARSLSIWTGMDAPADVMLKVLREQFFKG